MQAPLRNLGHRETLVVIINTHKNNRQPGHRVHNIYNLNYFGIPTVKVKENNYLII